MSEGSSILVEAPLTDKERAFAIEYITNGFNQSKAAKKVGLNSGRKALSNPSVAKFIANLQNEYLAEAIVTKNTISGMLDRLEDIAMGDEQAYMVDALGEAVLVNKFYPDLAVKILDRKAKLHGIIKDDDNKSPVNIQINVGDLLGNG